ncbi:MAG: C-GCAxxG-C-C family (seleno)protein [Candidatus Omnitrophica bacterium]|nr:C-GCAxxG-C-C family (seleno)protein [Candidatus Omnitrophota bacterium]
MSKEKAKMHYKGHSGADKLNCGQAIIAAFREKFSLNDEAIKLFAGYGAGKAPGGECGAFYAARFILDGKNKDKIKACEEMFTSSAGSTKCKEIKALKKFPCLGCVEKIAEFLETI